MIRASLWCLSLREVPKYSPASLQVQWSNDRIVRPLKMLKALESTENLEESRMGVHLRTVKRHSIGKAICTAAVRHDPPSYSIILAYGPILEPEKGGVYIRAFSLSRLSARIRGAC
jgi:hypothetical protein